MPHATDPINSFSVYYASILGGCNTELGFRISYVFFFPCQFSRVSTETLFRKSFIWHLRLARHVQNIHNSTECVVIYLTVRLGIVAKIRCVEVSCTALYPFCTQSVRSIPFHTERAVFRHDSILPRALSYMFFLFLKCP